MLMQIYGCHGLNPHRCDTIKCPVVCLMFNVTLNAEYNW